MSLETRKRGRPSRDRVPLDKARIVEAALALADVRGLEALTVRGVADALSVTPMAVYNHVADKQAMVGAILDHVVSLYAPGDHDEADIEAWLVTTFTRMHRALGEHHALVPLLSTWFALGPEAVSMSLLESCLARLDQGGFAPEAAVDAFYTLLGFTVGHASIDAAIRVQLGGRVTPEAQRRYALTMEAIALGAHPTVARFAPALADAFAPERFEKALWGIVRNLNRAS